MTRLGIERKLNLFGLLLRHPSVFLGRREYVLVLSHMRGLSSLLAHVLGSHPAISGYAEMHVAYLHRRNFLSLRGAVARSLDGRLTGHFVLDKVVQDYYPIAPSILHRTSVHPIFLVRKPAATLASLQKMYEEVTNLATRPSEEAITTYYVERLATLERMARERSSDALVVRAENLTGDPQATLTRLAEFLQIDRLEPTYSTFRLTGVRGRADASPALRTGRILAPAGDPVEVPVRPELLASAEDAYVRCVETLEQLFGAGALSPVVSQPT